MRLMVTLAGLAIAMGSCSTPAKDPALAANDRECRFTTGVGSAPGERICATKAAWEFHDRRQEAESKELGHVMSQGIDRSAPIPPPPPRN